ncbi:MAG: septum site-determining protein Ssd [Actinomycetes bacterium]
MDLASAAPTVVATGDRTLRDAVLSVAAAAGLDCLLVDRPDALRPLWNRAALVVLGVDLAPDVLALALPRRGGIYLAGTAESEAQLCGWSAQLGAAVAVLPAAAVWLSAAMADSAGPIAGKGQVIAVRGATGGVGASTLAAGLAVVAARSGRRVLLVDGDLAGGGIDLLLGAERVPGWRWPRLASARGHLGDLSGQLPSVDGIDVLSADRDEAGGEIVAPEQMRAVLRSGVRSHDLVVVDLPRTESAVGAEPLRTAVELILLVPADVRGVAAARGWLSRAEVEGEISLMVRRLRGPGLGAQTVADSLRLPLVGVLGDDPGLVSAAARGEPPARAGRSPLARLCRDLLEQPEETRRVVA